MWQTLNIALLVTLLASTAYAGQPVLDRDFADPFVLPTPGGLVAYATNTGREGHGLNLQVSRSRDGHRWERARRSDAGAATMGVARPTRHLGT